MRCLPRLEMAVAVIEHGLFRVDLPRKNGGSVHSFVSLLEGNSGQGMLLVFPK